MTCIASLCILKSSENILFYTVEERKDMNKLQHVCSQDLQSVLEYIASRISVHAFFRRVQLLSHVRPWEVKYGWQLFRGASRSTVHNHILKTLPVKNHENKRLDTTYIIECCDKYFTQVLLKCSYKLI